MTDVIVIKADETVEEHAPETTETDTGGNEWIQITTEQAERIAVLETQVAQLKLETTSPEVLSQTLATVYRRLEDLEAETLETVEIMEAEAQAEAEAEVLTLPDGVEADPQAQEIEQEQAKPVTLWSVLGFR